MKRKTLMTFLVFGLVTFVGACSGGTKTCTATGLTPNQTYSYYYRDSDGNDHSGIFTPSGTTFSVENVDSSIDCSSIDIERYVMPLIAMEGSAV